MENSKMEEHLNKALTADNDKNLVIAGQSFLIAMFMVHPFLRAVWLLMGGYHLGVWFRTRRKAKAILKIISLTTADLPPEIRKRLEGVDKAMKNFFESKMGKCDDPHCKNCWDLGSDGFKGHEEK
jgi:hypothetical protein